MKEIWYIERKSYRKESNKKFKVAEQLPDGGGDLKLYETYEVAKNVFDSIKEQYKTQNKVINEEEFPNESITVQSKYVKDIYTNYTLRPVQLKETEFE